MGARVTFEIDLDILGELSQVSILRAVRLCIDNQVGPSSGYGLGEAEFNFEHTSLNQVECVRSWRLSCDQPPVNDLSLPVPNQYIHPSMSLTEEAAAPYRADALLAVPSEHIPSQPLEVGSQWLPEFDVFSGTPGPPTYRNELEVGSRGRTMSRRGGSSSRSRSKNSKAVPYRPDLSSSFSSSSSSSSSLSSSSSSSSSSKLQDTESPRRQVQQRTMKQNISEAVQRERSELHSRSP